MAEFRAEPYRPAMRHIAVLFAAAALLERMLDDEQIMNLLKQRKAAPRPFAGEERRPKNLWQTPLYAVWLSDNLE